MNSFFGTDRSEVILAIARLGDKSCCYAGGSWLDRRCDCKYGGPSRSPNTENTGCPELRNAYQLLMNMTDEEYVEILSRSKNVMLMLRK